MNKKGFTLVELLAVIVILGIVATIGTTSIIGARKKINEKMVNTKLGEIVTAAKDYGQDHKSASSINVKTLVTDGYLETEETCTGYTENCIKNNVTESRIDTTDNIICLKRTSGAANRTNACILIYYTSLYGGSTTDKYLTDSEYVCKDSSGNLLTDCSLYG